MTTEAAHAANYARESKLKTMTVSELHAALSGVIANGEGHLPVSVMECDGLTHAVPIKMCFRSDPYDGDRVWIILDHCDPAPSRSGLIRVADMPLTAPPPAP